MQTSDGSRWIPNTIAVCPYTMQPHGGLAAGFTSLSGNNITEEEVDDTDEPEFTGNGQVIPE